MIYKSAEKQRILKVEDAGDHYKKQVILQIRLRGKWLSKAGLKANEHVKIENPEPGMLIIQSL